MALKSQKFSKSQLGIFVTIFAIIGGIIIYRSFAAGNTLVIASGGTYSGSWSSTDTTPAVKIQTSQPVIIENSNISTTGTGKLIDAGYPGADVTVRNSTLSGPSSGSDTAFYSLGYKNIVFQNNNLTGTWGIRIDGAQQNATVSVKYNKVKNIITNTSSLSHFFQAANNSYSANIEVAWNEVIDTFTQTNVEDIVNIYNVSGTKIHDNYLQGAYPQTLSGAFSGSGIAIDSSAHDNEVYNNQVVDTTNGGIGIASGYNNKVHNNRVISDGRDDAGNLFAAANVGLAVYNYDNYPNFTNNDSTYNTVGWVRYDGARNNMWFDAASGVNQSDYATNTELPDPINHALEQAEYQIWQNKLSANSVIIGRVATAGANYYVDSNGNDSNNGSQALPWKTVAKACSSVPAGSGSTIHINAGAYTESQTCNLACTVNLDGAGATLVSIKGSADPLINLANCTASDNQQFIKNLKLDGQNKSAGIRGLNVYQVRGLTISGLDVQNFKGAQSGDLGGGAINVTYAWNLDLGNSTLKNSSSVTAMPACTGTLGVSEIYDSKIHDLNISDNLGYGVKVSKYPAKIQNTDFYNLNVLANTPDPDGKCASWNQLAFELFEIDALNVQIRNSTFNKTVSLTDPGTNTTTLPAGSYKYRIHNNLFNEDGGNNYAMELDQNSSEINNNYFNGGNYPIANFIDYAKLSNYVHHNVFDNQSGPTALSHFTGGLTNSNFYRNTLVMRQPSWSAGVFSFDEKGNTSNVNNIKDNIFYSTASIGDKLGTVGTLSTSTIDHNGFYNLNAKGTNTITANPQLPLTGGFPTAYIPATGSPDSGIGAFADGAWSVGPQTTIAKLGDLDGNGTVDVTDLSMLLTKFGTADAVADIDKSGMVDVTDLSILLSHFGS